jgi:hypothetical protein
MGGLKRPSPVVLSLALLATTALAGCERAGGASGLCVPFAAKAVQPAAAGGAATAPPIAAGDPSAALDDCLHRWAYALAASPDDASHVAQAALTACGSSLARWNQQAAAAGPEGAAPLEAPSLLTGRPTTPIAEHMEFAQGRALFYVVQARAGKCAGPPVAGGAPVGLTRD